MIKKIIILTITLLPTLTQAEYNIIIPLNQSIGLIKFVNKQQTQPPEKWQPTEPIYGNWINYETYFGCDNNQWTGNKSGDIYRAINSTCKINQTRTVQEREIETTMLSYRNVGKEKTEMRTLTNQTYTNIGNCVYGDNTSNPNYYELWYWTKITFIIDNITYYADGITSSVNGKASDISQVSKIDKNSIYAPNFNMNVVYFKGDYKTSKSGYDYYELCNINI